jgi:hypothetical protein
MFTCRVSSGQNIGIQLTPHRFRDGAFRVSKAKEGPYFAVKDELAIETYLGHGCSLRMSNKRDRHSPSLIPPESIEGWK